MCVVLGFCSKDWLIGVGIIVVGGRVLIEILVGLRMWRWVWDIENWGCKELWYEFWIIILRSIKRGLVNFWVILGRMEIRVRIFEIIYLGFRVMVWGGW